MALAATGVSRGGSSRATLTTLSRSLAALEMAIAVIRAAAAADAEAYPVRQRWWTIRGKVRQNEPAQFPGVLTLLIFLLLVAVR